MLLLLWVVDYDVDSPLCWCEQGDSTKSRANSTKSRKNSTKSRSPLCRWGVHHRVQESTPCLVLYSPWIESKEKTRNNGGNGRWSEIGASEWIPTGAFYFSPILNSEDPNQRGRSRWYLQRKFNERYEGQKITFRGRTVAPNI